MMIIILCKRLEDTPFTEVIKNIPLRKVLESLISSVVILLYRTEMIVEDSVEELGLLITLGI